MLRMNCETVCGRECVYTYGLFIDIIIEIKNRYVAEISTKDSVLFINKTLRHKDIRKWCLNVYDVKGSSEKLSQKLVDTPN